MFLLMKTVSQASGSLLLLPSSFLSLWKPNYSSNFVYYDDWFKRVMAEIVLAFVSHMCNLRERKKRTIVLWLFFLTPARCSLQTFKSETNDSKLFLGIFLSIFVPKHPVSTGVCVSPCLFFQLPNVLSIPRLSSTTTTFTVHRRSSFQSKEENKLFPTSLRID